MVIFLMGTVTQLQSKNDSVLESDVVDAPFKMTEYKLY